MTHEDRVEILTSLLTVIFHMVGKSPPICIKCIKQNFGGNDLLRVIVEYALIPTQGFYLIRGDEHSTESMFLNGSSEYRFNSIEILELYDFMTL